MDLSSLAASESGFLHLIDPRDGTKLNTDNGEPIGLVLGSMYSKEWRARQNRMANKRMHSKQKATAERLIEEANELLAAVTFEVRNLKVDGVEYTPQNIVELYGNRKYGWIRAQVDEYIGDDANFFQSSGTD